MHLLFLLFLKKKICFWPLSDKGYCAIQTFILTPYQLLNIPSSAKEAWSAGMTLRPQSTCESGTRVFQRQYGGCMYYAVENYEQSTTFQRIPCTENRRLNTQESQNKKERESQEVAFRFPQTSMKSLQCEAFLYTNRKLRAIFTASSPEPFCLPWKVFHGCFICLCPSLTLTLKG